MPEIKIWILAAAVSVMIAIIGFVIKVVTNQVIKKLDEIVMELKHLSKAASVQAEQIKELQRQDMLIHERLNEHAGRIRSIELKNK